jgi:hypothetical protein
MDLSEQIRLQAVNPVADELAQAVEIPQTETVAAENSSTFSVDIDGDGCADVEIKVKKQKRGRPAKRGNRG